MRGSRVTLAAVPPPIATGQTVAERAGSSDTIDFIVGVTDVLGEILKLFSNPHEEESFLAENRVKCLNRMTFTEDKAVMIGIMKILRSNIHLPCYTGRWALSITLMSPPICPPFAW